MNGRPLYLLSCWQISVATSLFKAVKKLYITVNKLYITVNKFYITVNKLLVIHFWIWNIDRWLVNLSSNKTVARWGPGTALVSSWFPARFSDWEHCFDELCFRSTDNWTCNHMLTHILPTSTCWTTSIKYEH